MASDTGLAIAEVASPRARLKIEENCIVSNNWKVVVTKSGGAKPSGC